MNGAHMPDRERESEDAAPHYVHEIEHGHAAYTDAELLEQCQLNAQAFILVVFSAVEEDLASLNRLVERVAATFAAGWQMDRDWQPVEVLDALLVNYRSFGATVEAYDPDDQAPSACLLYTSPSPRDRTRSRMPSSA